MQFCNICGKNSYQLKRINESEVKNGEYFVKVNHLLHIFQNDIVKFLLEDNNTLICNNCLKQLKMCFEFVQQIKESASKLNSAKEVKTEHDYYETIRNDERNETVNTKVTVQNARLNKQANSDANSSNLNFKPILPKTATKLVNTKVEKSLVTKTRVYKCLQCTEFFKSYKHLTEHEKDFCKNKFVKYLKVCKFCHKCYIEEDSLREHLSLKHAQGQFLCCLCQNKAFTAKGYLCRHIKKAHQHESLNFFCGLCTNMLCFPSQEELREHFLQSHPPQNPSTAVEDQDKTNKNEDDMDLEMHEEFLDEFLLAHTNENSFQFSECWEALDLHLSDMLQESAAQEFTQAFSCPKCYEQFKNPQPLLKHLADIHDLPVLICRVCRQCFASFKDFKRHKLQKCLKNSTLHSTTLECPYCSKKFKNSSNLKQHLRLVHCQFKKHICQLCDKQFSTLDHLKKHVLSQHQNERKHLCTVCDKKFTQLGHLKQHLAIHTTGKTIQCSECTLKFWRKIDLERHYAKNHVSGGGDN